MVPKSLTLHASNLYNLQGHANTIQVYSLVKRDLFWKGINKDIDKFIQNSNTCRHYDLQNNHVVTSTWHLLEHLLL